MIRQATYVDIPALKTLMQSEPAFWQDSWNDEVIEQGIKADVWKDAVGFYRALGWSEPDVILLRKKLEPKAM